MLLLSRVPHAYLGACISKNGAPSCKLCLLRRAQLGLGDGAALDFGTPADEALRAAVQQLEERNRALQSENKRLRVERVRSAVRVCVGCVGWFCNRHCRRQTCFSVACICQLLLASVASACWVLSVPLSSGLLPPCRTARMMT